jgi:hypothetical protein
LSIWCEDGAGEVLVWQGSTGCSHTPEGVYSKTSGCLNVADFTLQCVPQASSTTPGPSSSSSDCCNFNLPDILMARFTGITSKPGQPEDAECCNSLNGDWCLYKRNFNLWVDGTETWSLCCLDGVWNLNLLKDCDEPPEPSPSPVPSASSEQAESSSIFLSCTCDKGLIQNKPLHVATQPLLGWHFLFFEHPLDLHHQVVDNKSL